MRKASSPVVPRDIVLLACGWIIGSWLLTIGIRTPLLPSPSGYQTKLQLLLVLIGVGFYIGWPLLRLSQRPPRKLILDMWLDLLVLLALWQAVFWPLDTVSHWPSGSLITLNILTCLWTIAIGGILALTLPHRSQLVRCSSMALILIITLLPLGVALVMVAQGVDPAIWTSSSPLELIRQVTSADSLASAPLSQIIVHAWIWLIGVSLATILIWLAVLMRQGMPQSEPTTRVKPAPDQ